MQRVMAGLDMEVVHFRALAAVYFLTLEPPK
jgi:hypothetical protein